MVSLLVRDVHLNTREGLVPPVLRAMKAIHRYPEKAVSQVDGQLMFVYWCFY